MTSAQQKLNGRRIRCWSKPVGFGLGFVVLLTIFCLGFSLGRTGWSETSDIYVTRIKPILRDRCYSCHGGLEQKAGLRVDTVASMFRGGDSGSAIVKSDADKSLLFQRVTAESAAERMPPEDSGTPLTPDQLGALRTWLSSGALAPADEQADTNPLDHWSFRSIQRPSLPGPGNVSLTQRSANWSSNAIDRFISQQHESSGLVPEPEVARAVLLRRLYLDLIGIPPSLDELEAFERDPDPTWYEKAVDRLLDDPRHSERWGRHWMDVWRYSDWWGLGAQLRNSQKHIWHWRDWIIDSLSVDRPYDEMVQLMLAADELYPNDLDKLRASGFLARNYFLFNRHQWMDEVVEHVGKGFLALTLNCAKCHEHKYDPIEQRDYYRMRAVFEPYHVRVDVVPGESDLVQNGIPRAFDGHLDLPTYLFVRGQENQPDTTSRIEPNIPRRFNFGPFIVRSVSLPNSAYQPERRQWVSEGYLRSAKDRVLSSDAKVETLREKMNATKSADAATSATHDAANLQNDLELAELAAASSRAELQSLELAVAVLHDSWQPDSVATGTGPQKLTEASGKALRIEAERAARAAVVAKSRFQLFDAERRLKLAATDKKAPVEKEVEKAKEALTKATKELNAPSSPVELSKIDGAAWTPTRFFNSTKDDPAVTFPPTSSGRRTALAEWITDPKNPLFARVAVNHIWMRHLGVPLVSSVFDFGRHGHQPIHPELLDWLASELRDHNWSMKHIHRLIVTSSTYRLSSSVSASSLNQNRDPDNRKIWRRGTVRLESQVVRDSILALAGTLDLRRGGPPVLAAQQAESKRRSLYFFHSNNERNLFLTTFDEALVSECYRREQSIVPQQAMALTNSQLVLEACQQIAERIDQSMHVGGALDGGIGTGANNTTGSNTAGNNTAGNDSAGNDSAGNDSAGNDSAEKDLDILFIRRAFTTVLNSSASDSEIAACRQAIRQWRGQSDSTRTGPWANLVWVLINHNDFVTMR